MASQLYHETRIWIFTQDLPHLGEEYLKRYFGSGAGRSKRDKVSIPFANGRWDADRPNAITLIAPEQPGLNKTPGIKDNTDTVQKEPIPIAGNAIPNRSSIDG